MDLARLATVDDVSIPRLAAAASILRLLRDATELPAYPADAARKIRRHQLKSFFGDVIN
jgi:hypothetical protein